MFIYNNTDILNPDDMRLRPMNGYGVQPYGPRTGLRVLSGTDQYLDPFISEIGADEPYGDNTGLRPLSGLGQATYTDAQVAQGLRESIAQGFSLLDSMAGAVRVFGVPIDQAYRAGDIVALEMQRGVTFTAPADAIPTYTDAEVAQGLRESVAQGFSLEDSIAGAIRVYNIPVDQAERAGAIVAREMRGTPPPAAATIYTDAEVTQGLRESVAQGFSLEDSIAGAIRVYNIPADQAQRAGAIVAKEMAAADDAARKAAADAAAAAAAATRPVGTPVYTDAQVAQGLRESVAQGFSLLDSIAGAIRVYNIPVDQAYRAGDIVAKEMQAAAKAAADAAAAKAAADARAAADAAAAKAAADARAAADAAAARAAATAKAAADAAAKTAADAAAKKLAAEAAARAAAEATAKNAADAAAKQAAAAAAAKAAADAATKAAAAAAAKSQADAAAATAAGQTTGGNIGPLLLAVAAAYVLGA